MHQSLPSLSLGTIQILLSKEKEFHAENVMISLFLLIFDPFWFKNQISTPSYFVFIFTLILFINAFYLSLSLSVSIKNVSIYTWSMFVNAHSNGATRETAYIHIKNWLIS